mgnify:FL=1
MSKIIIDLKKNVIEIGGRIAIDMNEEKIMVNMDGDPPQAFDGTSEPQTTLHEWFNQPKQVTERKRPHDAVSAKVRHNAKRKRGWYVGKRITMADGTKATVVEHVRGRQYLVKYNMRRGKTGSFATVSRYAAHYEKEDHWDWWEDRKRTKAGIGRRRVNSGTRTDKHGKHRCSICGKRGHNRRTCPLRTQDSSEVVE